MYSNKTADSTVFSAGSLEVARHIPAVVLASPVERAHLLRRAAVVVLPILALHPLAAGPLPLRSCWAVADCTCSLANLPAALPCPSVAVVSRILLLAESLLQAAWVVSHIHPRPSSLLLLLEIPVHVDTLHHHQDRQTKAGAAKGGAIL